MPNGERKVECCVVPYFPSPIGYQSSFPGIANAFFFDSFCVLRSRLGNCQVGGPKKYGQKEVWASVHLQIDMAGQIYGLRSILG